MPHIDTYFDDPYLKAGHLNAVDMIVTIRDIKQEAVGRESELKPVLFFEEFKKGMIVNKTNAGRIVELYGSETSAWKGCKITLYPSETDFGGKTVECIRVRPQAPPAQGLTTAPEDI